MLHRNCRALSRQPRALSTPIRCPSRPGRLSQSLPVQKRDERRPSHGTTRTAFSALPSPSTPTTTPQPRQPPRVLTSTPDSPLVFAFNLDEHELDALRSLDLYDVVEVGRGTVADGSLLDVDAGSVVVSSSRPPPPSPSPFELSSVRATLLVLPRGCSANDGASEALSRYPAAVDEALTEAECPLCVTGVGVRAKNDGDGDDRQTLSQALARLARAHATAYGIWNPLPSVRSEEKVPKDATLAMAAFLDAAPWNDESDDDRGGDESDLDLSGLAVVDGLLSPRETRDLLLYLTDGEPSSPSEESGKWRRGAVVDHDGCDDDGDDGGDDDGDGGDDGGQPPPPPPSSWGATPEFIESLLSSPPPQLLSLCSRIRALYSTEFEEVVLCPGNGEMSEGLTPLVLNAVVPGDAPSLRTHVDADPARSDPDGAWARAFGLYRNRTRRFSPSSSSSPSSSPSDSCRGPVPLLATALLYLQDTPVDAAGETLFFDAEEAGLGLAVRPKGGRVVFAEQDVAHRIVPPTTLTSPRYSVVLKLALFPRVGGGGSEGESPTSVVLPAWRGRALRLGTAGGRGWPLPLSRGDE